MLFTEQPKSVSIKKVLAAVSPTIILVAVNLTMVQSTDDSVVDTSFKTLAAVSPQRRL
jgi:hypothetical protein